MVKRIQLNQLPKYSNWPELLLGIKDFSKKNKSKEEILREYDLEKWGNLYNKILKETKPILTIDYLDRLFLGNENTIFSIQDKLYLSEIIYAHRIYQKNIYDSLKKYIIQSNTVIELGAGYGSVIFNLAKKFEKKSKSFIAAELTKQGQKCLTLLSEVLFNKKVDVCGCDFTSSKIIEMDIPKDSLIFTSLAITCVPNLPNDFLENIIKLKPKFIINFEPIPQFFGDTLLGLLRKKYIELNDYNSTLFEILKEGQEKGKIEILEINKNIFGENCFLPASVIVWKPK